MRYAHPTHRRLVEPGSLQRVTRMCHRRRSIRSATAEYERKFRTEEFCRELGVEIKTIADFKLLDQAESYVGSAGGAVTETLAGVRLLAKLSPNPRTGKKPKEKLILQLERQLVDASATKMPTMRNLNTRPFEDGYRVWESVSRWVEFGAEPDPV